LTLNTEQQKIFDDIINQIKMYFEDGSFGSDYFMITGRAGTGKSFLTAELVKYFSSTKESSKKVQVSALTHKALKELKSKLSQSKVNLGDLLGISTLHSYFNIAPKITKEGLQVFEVQKFKKAPKKCSILFVDESSMIDEALFDIIQKQSFLYNIVIFVGDEFQLNPVNNTDFNIFKHNSLRTYTLNNIVRQAQDNPIIKLASKIVDKIKAKDYADKSYCIKEIIKAQDNKHIVVKESEKEFIKDYYNRVHSDNNKPILDSKFYETVILSYTNKNVNMYNNIAKRIYKNSNTVNIIDKGDLLILQEPSFDKFLKGVIQFQNNDEFYVTDLKETQHMNIDIYEAYQNEDFIRIIKPSGINMYNMMLKSLADSAKKNPRNWKAFYDFKAEFTEIKQAFSCTVHKAQGSTVQEAFVDLRGMPWSQSIDLAFRLTYVALTRASEKATFLI